MTLVKLKSCYRSEELLNRPGVGLREKVSTLAKGLQELQMHIQKEGALLGRIHFETHMERVCGLISDAETFLKEDGTVAEAVGALQKCYTWSEEN